MGLFSFNIVFTRCVYVAACVSGLFLLVAGQYSNVWM